MMIFKQRGQLLKKTIPLITKQKVILNELFLLFKGFAYKPISINHHFHALKTDNMVFFILYLFFRLDFLISIDTQSMGK